MSELLIQESTLTAIGDAMRDKTPGGWNGGGPITKYAHTPNYEDDGTVTGNYPAGEHEMTIIIPGARYYEVTYQVKLPTYSDGGPYLKIMNANKDPADETIKYAESANGTKTYGSSTNYGVKFYFYAPSEGTSSSYPGYYATVIGLDTDRNPLLSEKTPAIMFDPAQMASTISSWSVGGVEVPDEALAITGTCGSRFAYGNWDWFIEAKGNEMSSYDIQSASGMFQSSDLTRIPFSINMQTSKANTAQNIFRQMRYLEEAPTITGAIHSHECMYDGCYRLREITDESVAGINWSLYESYTSSPRESALFSECYSLRHYPASLLGNSNKKITNSSSSVQYNQFYELFYYCYCLDEMADMTIPDYYLTVSFTNNLFNKTFSRCARAKRITFAMPDGSPYSANWSNQVIDLSDYVGYTNSAGNITGFNSGITTDKRIENDEDYANLKDDVDSWTSAVAYARYNHDSAVETINSLPNLTGSGNTIKFKGTAGGSTDGGAISALTEEEIAVATAKGWTVTLV